MTEEMLVANNNVSYTEADLRVIYKKYAKAHDMIVHPIMVSIQVQAYLEQQIGQVSEAIAYHELNPTRSNRDMMKPAAFVLVGFTSAIAAVWFLTGLPIVPWR